MPNPRINTVTVIRATVDSDNMLSLVVSANPFGPTPSAHLQRYRIHPNGRATLIIDSPYRTESAAAAKFDFSSGRDLTRYSRDPQDIRQAAEKRFTTEGEPSYAPWQPGICQHCNMHESVEGKDFCQHCLNDKETTT
jgi:hypothetical protein